MTTQPTGERILDVSDPAESAANRLRGWLQALVSHRHGSEVYQTSTMGALLDGVYDGDVTIRELLEHGDFGLGTFNGLDGEMLVLDGVCYQLRGDGSAQPAEPDQCTPFAVVTWFDADRSFEVSAARRPRRTQSADRRVVAERQLDCRRSG